MVAGKCGKWAVWLFRGRSHCRHRVQIQQFSIVRVSSHDWT